MKAAENPKASIILLTRNSSRTIKSVLDGIMSQKVKDFEILLIDSSSTDSTLEIAKNYPCKIISIKTTDFGHGKTRNFAAGLAKGEFIVFLTHDSVPRSDTWLEGLLKPFSDQKVAGVYGKQVPREDEKILDKCFQTNLYGDTGIIWNANNWKQGDNLFSDANSAVRKSILLKYPYADNIIVSEDYEWAVRILKLNYNIIYSIEGLVTHSHSYNIRTLFKRNFDVGVSYKMIYDSGESRGFITKGTNIFVQEARYLYRTKHIMLIPQAFIRDIVRYVAISIGKQEHLFSKNMKRMYLSGQGWYWK